MSELIFENPFLILLMEHFRIDFIVHDLTVYQLCEQNTINSELFIFFCNLYNGFTSPGTGNISKQDISSIISFLRNSHNFYKNDKYPEIRDYINQMYSKNNVAEIKLVEQFFDEYFNEVTEHLDYEDQVAFPSISEKLKLENTEKKIDPQDFTISIYSEHHTDIESKLSELKNLLLKYIPLKEDHILRRKLLFSLFELEYDLKIHSRIEESILIPLVKKIEMNLNE